MFDLLREDWRANKKNPRGQFLSLLFRFAHFFDERRSRWPFLSIPVLIFYKLITEFWLGTEIQAGARIGPGMRIFHGYGTVVHRNAKIGRNVTLRQGVTIGSKREGDDNAPEIGDDVSIGANAILIGGVRIGDRSIIAAGAVVVRDVDDGDTVGGNPARSIRSSHNSATSRPAT